MTHWFVAETPDRPARSRQVLGFGRIGWIAVGLGAVAFVGVKWGGWDPFYLFMKALVDLGYTDLMLRFAGFSMLYTLAFSTAHLNLVTLTYVLSALHLSNRRIRGGWVAALVFWCALYSLVVPLADYRLGEVAALKPIRKEYGLQFDLVVYSVFDIASALLAGLSVGSRRLSVLLWGMPVLIVSLYWGLMLASSFVLPLSISRWLPIFWVLDYGWIVCHALTATVCLWWAWSARNAKRDSALCVSCNYDLRGSRDTRVCPECGAGNPVPPAARSH